MPNKLLSILLLLPVAVSMADDLTTEEQIEQAVLALPESLREGATVIRFEEGRQIILRAGDNGLFCRVDDPDSPGIALWCYPRAHDEYARRWYQLAADGMAARDVDAQIADEIKAGEIEWPPGIVNYNLRGPNLDNAVSTTVIYVPFATGADLGIQEERDFHRPWLMYAGTAFAHIMMPGE